MNPFLLDDSALRRSDNDLRDRGGTDTGTKRATSVVAAASASCSISPLKMKFANE